MSDSAIATCPNCGKRNRVRASPTGFPHCKSCHTALPWIMEADTDDFDEHIAAAVAVLVDFWAAWCGPCHAISPVLEDLAREEAGLLKLVKLNVEEAPEIARRYEVQGIPLLVLHREGREVDRLVGAAPKAQVRQWLERNLTPTTVQ